MIISHRQQFIFIHVHRTAGSSLSNILRPNLVGNHITLDQHSNLKTLGSDFLEKHKDYFTFGFTRNPWDRILSWYKLLHMNQPKELEQDKKRFEEFLLRDQAIDMKIPFFHYNTLDYFSTKDNELINSQIFRYEELQTEVKSLFQQLKFPFAEIPTLNSSDKKDYRSFYTNKSKELIAEKCQKDIQYFHYEF